MSSSIVNEPKTGTFQIRINPDFKEELEKLYSECGMTLTEAVNIFFHMSLVTGGLPFMVNKEPRIVMAGRMADYILSLHEKGMESVKSEKDLISFDELYARYEDRE
jgi:addiction module RelB/DinJ family antitoxin